MIFHVFHVFQEYFSITHYRVKMSRYHVHFNRRTYKSFNKHSNLMSIVLLAYELRRKNIENVLKTNK